MTSSLQPSRLWRTSVVGIVAASVGVGLAAATGLGFWAFVLAAALSTVCAPVVVDLRRAPGASAEGEPEEASAEAPVQAAPQGPDELTVEQLGDLRRALTAALWDLPPQERAAFVLHRDRGLLVSEIASATGMSTESVENDLERASARMTAAGWGPERGSLVVDLLRQIDWADIGIYETTGGRSTRHRR